VKIAFLFFLLITHLCGAPASWAARHTTVCLDDVNQKYSQVIPFCSFPRLYMQGKKLWGLGFDERCTRLLK